MIRTDIVKITHVDDTYYVLDDVPYTFSETLGRVASEIYVPSDKEDEYKNLNSTIVNKIKPYNYGEIRNTQPSFYKHIAVIMTNESNPEVLSVLYENHLCKGDEYMTLEEATKVTGEQIGEIFRGNTDIKHFEEFQYFTNVEYIPKYAFWECFNLESLCCPTSVTEIQGNMIGVSPTSWNQGKRCKIKYITGLKNVIIAGGASFQHLTNIESVDFSDKLERVTGNLFMHCPSIKDVGDLSGVQSCSSYLLGGCDYISSISIKHPYKLISCKNLHDIQMDWDAVTSLPFNFIGSDGQTGHEGANIESIPNMPNLTTLTRSSNKSIAFQNCFYLEYFGSTPKLTSIPMGTFLGCRRLRECKDLSSVTEILQQGFDGCNSLENMTLPICNIVGANAFRLDSNYEEGNFTIRFGKAYDEITFTGTSFNGRHKDKCKIYCNDVELTDEQYTAVGVIIN